jgi:hypothetical protein
MSTHNPNFIPGIYNWCDRWCERCAFIARCSVGAEEMELMRQGQELDNEIFWNKIAENFEKARTLLYKAAARFGIDLDAIPQEELDAAQREHDVAFKSARKDARTTLAHEYAAAVHKWMNSAQFEALAIRAQQEIDLGIVTQEASQAQALAFKECIDVVRWYHTIIPSKIHRAVMEIHDTSRWDEGPEEQQLHNGSAKVALISIERSIQAWGGLMHVMHEEEDAIIRLLAMLQKLQRLMVQKFPLAEKFKRPGFDD